jgi:WD repeat-containing protein 23
MFSSVGHAEATPDEVFSSGDIDLKEDEILEEDRTDEGEVDDSPDFHRFVNVISVPKGREDEPIGARASKRRQWEIVPLRATRNQWTKSGRSSTIKRSEQA